MFGTVAFLLLACAGAVYVDAGITPPYYEALQHYKGVRQGLQDIILSLPDKELPIDDYRRHYIVISNFITQFALSLSGCVVPSYSDTYLEELGKQIPYALAHSVEVVQTGRSLVNKTDESIRDLEELIDDLCAEELSREFCDLLLDVVIQLNEEKYGKEVNALLALRDAAVEFEKRAEGIYLSATSYSEIEYLINSRDDLRPLILKLADAFRIVNDYRGESC